MKIKMLLDTEGQRGGNLFSNRVYKVSDKFGKEMIEKERAIEYDEIRDAKRICIIDGKEVTWSEYLKRRKH